MFFRYGLPNSNSHYREYYFLVGPQAPQAKCPCHQLVPVSPPTCDPEPPGPKVPHTALVNPLQPGLVGVCGPKNTPLPRIMPPDPPQLSLKTRPLPCGLGCHCQDVDSLQVCIFLSVTTDIFSSSVRCPRTSHHGPSSTKNGSKKSIVSR